MGYWEDNTNFNLVVGNSLYDSMWSPVHKNPTK